MRALVVVIAVAIASPAAAQPRNPPAQPGQPAQPRREAIKKKIRTMRAYTLTEELGLDEQTAARLFPILARWDDVTDKLLQARVDIQRRLNANPPAEPKALDRLIDDALANQRAFWDLEEKRLAELRKVLTPAQIARLLVVLPAFERKIQNQLRRAIRRGARRDAAVEPDDEDDVEADEPAPRPRRR
jgi:hypothetical protein